jgi:hypothetical protein
MMMYELNARAWSVLSADKATGTNKFTINDAHTIVMANSPGIFCEANGNAPEGCGDGIHPDPVFDFFFGDPSGCATGSASGCAWTAMTFFPVGKVAKLLKDGDDAAKAFRAGAKSKELPISVESFEQARNLALDLLGPIDMSTRESYVSRLASSKAYGKVVGFTTKVDGVPKQFRIDFDPDKLTHINVTVGRGADAVKFAISWPGTEADYLKLLDGNT